MTSWHIGKAGGTTMSNKPFVSRMPANHYTNGRVIDVSLPRLRYAGIFDCGCGRRTPIQY
jgi:hypothetical protein